MKESLTESRGTLGGKLKAPMSLKGQPQGNAPWSNSQIQKWIGL